MKLYYFKGQFPWIEKHQQRSKTNVGLYWLFLPEHKLELMFSSIEPHAPCGCVFLVIFSLLFEPYTRTLYLYPHIFLPANEKISLHMHMIYQPISSARSSLVYAKDRSRSSHCQQCPFYCA